MIENKFWQSKFLQYCTLKVKWFRATMLKSTFNVDDIFVSGICNCFDSFNRGSQS